MLSTFANLFLAAVVTRNAIAQFVDEPKDLKKVIGYAGIPVRYKQVPTGICELDPNVKSFSGYADVEKNEHIFFWFFESRDVNPHVAPLTVWINGGPGSSSMIGLFQELGPCGIDYSGEVYNNPYSYSKVSNMLFIDQPTTTGFSYSKTVPGYLDAEGNLNVLRNNTCPPNVDGTCGTFSDPNYTILANSTLTAAPGMWKALQGFMGAFPQYSNNGFNFATESYGGHYGPVFNEYFEKQNRANIPGTKKIDLQSVMIGNGWFDPVIQYQAYYNFTVYPGNTYDYSPYNESIQEQLYDNVYGPDGCLNRLRLHCSKDGDYTACNNADNFCANNVEAFLDTYPNRDEYDIRELWPDPFPYNFYVDYLNKAEVQAAVGAYANYSDSSVIVGNAFASTGDDGRESNTMEDVAALVRRGVTVALYAGDADYNCNWLGGEKVAELVNVPGWANAGYVDIMTSDDRVHGQVKQSGKFSFSRIYQSGHEVPFYQPITALEMFARVIGGRDVATGKHKPGKCYRTNGTPKSIYREGNATVQWQVVPVNITYDVNKNGPGAPWPVSSRKRTFKPRTKFIS